MTRVLIVDDHAIVRIGIKMMLESAGMECVGETGKGVEAAELVERLKPDVTLLDLRLSDIDGIEALCKIRSAVPKAKVIMVSSFEPQEDVFRAIKSGAKGYMLKDSGSEKFIAGIRAVLSGGMCFSESARKKYEERLTIKGLSARETEITELMAKGLTAEEIAGVLGVTANTVRTLASRVIEKTGTKNTAGAVFAAISRVIIRVFGGTQ